MSPVVRAARTGCTDTVQYVTSSDSSNNTNVKSEINKVSSNKRCHFLQNIVPINETSEQNCNGYCNVDFVFTLDPPNASLMCGMR
jgi:hypothetical protein